MVLRTNVVLGQMEFRTNVVRTSVVRTNVSVPVFSPKTRVGSLAALLF